MVGTHPLPGLTWVVGPPSGTAVGRDDTPSLTGMDYDPDWKEVINTARYLYAQEERMQVAEAVVEEELRHWTIGDVTSRAADMAGKLRGTFGVRAPTQANWVLGERFLLDSGAETLDTSMDASLAVKLWLTPNVFDRAVGGPVFSRWVVTELPGVSKEFCSPPDAPFIRLQPGRATLKRVRKTVNFHNFCTRDIYRVHANSLANLERGFVTRVWRYKGEDPVAPLRSRCPKFERVFRGYPVSAISYQDVVERSLPRRRLIFQSAAESLLTSPLTYRDSYVSTFVKAEKFNWTTKPDADPRLIQPRSPRFLVSHGRYIKAIEHHVFKCLGRLNHYPMVAKGFNARDTAEILRSKWSRFHDPICISLDASRFDQHVSVEMLRLTHRVYKRFNRDPEFMDLCRMTLDNTGFARCPEGGFKYKVRGRRMSGDMDTSCGNCVIMCAITYELVGNCAEIFNNGDDCLVIMERNEAPSAEAISKHYLDYGFRVVEEERVDVFERILFCQTQPVWAHGWVMCRAPWVIAKDLTYIGPKEADRAWLDAIGQCGMALADGVPILSAFYASLIDTSVRRGGIQNSMLYSCGMTRLAEGMVYRELPIVDRARVSFFKAFGVLPDVQAAVESSMGPLGKIQWLEGKAYLEMLEKGGDELLDYGRGRCYNPKASYGVVYSRLNFP
nr:RNA-dependent RNA polymerase [Grapevine umbra-like virus]